MKITAATKEEKMHPVEYLLVHYPALLNVEGIFPVLEKLLSVYQLPVFRKNRKKWNIMASKKQKKLRAAMSLVLIELVKWQAKERCTVPTIKHMDKVLTKADCPSLSTFIFEFDFFEGSYNTLLILAKQFPLNRDFATKD